MHPSGTLNACLRVRMQAPTLESSMMFPARQMSVDMEADPSEAAAAKSNAAAKPVRRILMGHSMGAVSAVAEAIKRPEVGFFASEQMPFLHASLESASHQQAIIEREFKASHMARYLPLQGLAALVLVSPALVALPMEPEAEAPGKAGHTHTAGQSMEAGFAYGHLMSSPAAPPRRQASSANANIADDMSCLVCGFVACW